MARNAATQRKVVCRNIHYPIQKETIRSDEGGVNWEIENSQYKLESNT